MKSAALKAVRLIEMQETPIPDIGQNEVLVKVMACGVCGTDVHIFEGDKGAADNPLPIILGHEFAGIAEKTGENIDDIKPGDHICVDPNVMCGYCYYCKSGTGHFCTHMTGIGTTVNGGFAQYCAVPRQQIYKLAEDVSFYQGAMSEPLSCCLHGIDLCEIKAGSHVVILGGGMIGLLMLQLARLQGASSVVLVEPVAGKRKVGLELGADFCIDPASEDTAQILQRKGIHRIDVVIECVGQIGTIRQAIDIAGKQSIVMMFGLTKPHDEIAIKPFELFKKEIVLKASFINPYTIGRAVDLINSKRIDVSCMTAEVVPLERLNEVLSSPEMRSLGKYIVDPWK
jgi:threonine dehydrogenase-like Zn-dependent dehydrogenase